MDIGKHKEDYKFYEGYEGEEEVIVTLSEVSYHFWNGYFDDIFGNPQFTDVGWFGFTRDCNEFINAFDDDCIECAIMPEEYLDDLALYRNHSFSYDETSLVLECLIAIMKEAVEKGDQVFVRVS